MKIGQETTRPMNVVLGFYLKSRPFELISFPIIINLNFSLRMKERAIVLVIDEEQRQLLLGKFLNQANLSLVIGSSEGSCKRNLCLPFP